VDDPNRKWMGLREQPFATNPGRGGALAEVVVVFVLVFVVDVFVVAL